MANNTFVYWLDGFGGRHLTIIVEMGGGGCGAFDKFFQVPGVCPVGGGGGNAHGWN